jgi:hypothetical protein
VLLGLGPAGAASPDPDVEGERAGGEAAGSAGAWILVDARNHARGTLGLVAVAFGVAQERGHNRSASLSVDCFDGRTAAHIDTIGLDLRSPTVAVRYSLDGGRYVSASWQVRDGGNGLDLSADRAIDFVSELFGKTELRLAVVRPLSVPFLLRFAVGGAEQILRPMAERCRWPAGPAISDAGR